MARVSDSSRNWLLLRGLGRGQGHWGSFASKIQDRFPDDYFEFLDLPGNGARNGLKSPLRVSDYVKDLRQQCGYIKRKEPFQILALSLGAMIAVDWMKSYPHEIERAYLVCTSSGQYSKFYERFQLPNLWKGASLLSSHANAEIWEQTILKMISNNCESRNSEISALIKYSQEHPVSNENILRQIWAGSRYRFPSTAPGEITLIGSYGDKLVDPSCTIRIAKAWGLTPRMHPTAGHDIPIDDPRWLLEQLL